MRVVRQGLSMDKKVTYHNRTDGSCNMNVLSHNSRVKPIAANFRSFGGTFGASGMTKLLRISDQSLGKKKRRLSIDDNESIL